MEEMFAIAKRECKTFMDEERWVVIPAYGVCVSHEVAQRWIKSIAESIYNENKQTADRLTKRRNWAYDILQEARNRDYNGEFTYRDYPIKVSTSGIQNVVIHADKKFIEVINYVCNRETSTTTDYLYLHHGVLENTLVMRNAKFDGWPLPSVEEIMKELRPVPMPVITAIQKRKDPEEV